MDRWRQDIRDAMRGLRRAPGFTGAVTVVLGIGIGTTAAVFSLLNAMFLVSPPVRAPARVVHVLASSTTTGSTAALTADEARGIEESSRGVEAVAAWTSTRGVVGEVGAPESVSTAVVSPGTFAVFDVAPLAGRLFTADDFADPTGAPVLIGHRLWRRTLGADPRAIGEMPRDSVGKPLPDTAGNTPRGSIDKTLRGSIGKTLRVDGERRTIIGVLPPGFAPFGYELWLPASTGRASGPGAATTGASLGTVPVTPRPSIASSTSATRASRATAPGSTVSSGGAASPGARVLSAPRVERSLVVLLRLKPGAGMAQAQEELRGVARRLEAARPDTQRGWTLRAQPVRALFASYPPQTIALLFAAVAMLWAIACINVANLLLSRGLDRAREASIRAALGATRGRLLRQFLTEGCVLGALGGVCGVAWAHWSLSLVRAVLPENVVQFGMPRGIDSVRLDPIVLLFLILCTCTTVIIFGLMPALRVARAAPADALTQRVPVTGMSQTWRRWTLRDALVVAEIALSVVLLVGAALMLASFRRMATVDRGMTLDRVITVDLQLASAASRDPERRRRVVRDLLQEVRSVPGVQQVALSSFRLRVPIGLESRTGTALESARLEGAPPTSSADRRVDVWTVTPEYPAVMGIPLLRGEGVDARGAPSGGALSDEARSGEARSGEAQSATVSGAPAISAAASGGALINRTMAQRFWPNRDPVGQSFTLASAGAPASAPPNRLTVIGVVGDVRWMRMPTRPLDLDPYPTVYRVRDPDDDGAYARVSVRTSGRPEAMAEAVRRAIWRVDRDLPLQLQIGEDLLARELARPRFNLALIGLFAALAVLLATFGVYGVVAYAVARSRTEIAVRLALGARRADVYRLVGGWASRLAIVGLAIGVGAALALARFARSQLFEVSATDPRVIASVAGLLLVVIGLAVWGPARRAARIQPARALSDGSAC